MNKPGRVRDWQVGPYFLSLGRYGLTRRLQHAWVGRRKPEEARRWRDGFAIHICTGRDLLVVRHRVLP